jgi:hypothetical protein
VVQGKQNFKFNFFFLKWFWPLGVADLPPRAMGVKPPQWPNPFSKKTSNLFWPLKGGRIAPKGHWMASTTLVLYLGGRPPHFYLFLIFLLIFLYFHFDFKLFEKNNKI